MEHSPHKALDKGWITWNGNAKHYFIKNRKNKINEVELCKKYRFGLEVVLYSYSVNISAKETWDL